MNPGYAYWCQIRVEEKDGAAILYWECGDDTLPFVPTPGMKLVFDNDGDDEYEIESVSWNTAQGCFWITLKTQEIYEGPHACPCKPDGNCCVLDTMISGWLSRGWKELERWKWSDDDESPKEAFADA